MEHKYKRAIAVGYTVSEDEDDLQDVHLIVPSLERVVTYRASNRGDGSSKLPVCGAVANFISKNSDALGDPIFVGFSLKDFVTRVGIGCARAGVYFPPELWLSPDKQPGFDLQTVLFSETSSSAAISKSLARLGEQFSGEDKKSFDKLVKGWKLFKEAERDGQLAFMLGSMVRVWG